ncbi:polyisoprenoid diphosphate/phosphate phosphohydrolase PLPP6-like [Tubulanus polymorphus]|uniref:polyisoprenoid diphosphate/phosphate phosphohydrolase PLPP6-like n=1 Tax=Tubulanus polymorphus TaxID=672921 RepID=UPI003DA57C46
MEGHQESRYRCKEPPRFKEFSSRDVSDSSKVGGDDDEETTVEKLIRIDVALTDKLAVCASKDRQLGYLRPVMKLLELSCHGIPWIAITLLLMWKLENKTRTQEILVNLMAGLIYDLILVGILKTVFHRRRPGVNKMDMFVTVSVDKYSFPSGHTTRAAMLLHFFLENVSLGVLCSVLFIIWALCVSISRVLLGRHHTFDVICGFIIGLLEYAVIFRYWLPPVICYSAVEYIQTINQ